jgi:kumamolisin
MSEQMRTFLVLAALATLVGCGSSEAHGGADAVKPPQNGTSGTPGPLPTTPPATDNGTPQAPVDDGPDPGPIATSGPVQPDSPPSAVYADSGKAAATTPIRALLSFAAHDLDKTAAIDDPSSPSFHKFLTQQQWLDQHAPAQADLDAVKAFITSQGFTVAHVATNRMLMEIAGTVDQFQKTFGAQVHVYDRTQAGKSAALMQVLSTPDKVVVPAAIADKTRGVLVIAPAASTDPLPAETPTAFDSPTNPTAALVPADISRIYGFDALDAKGTGETIAVVMGAAYKKPDLRAFWKAFGITHVDPDVVIVGEPPSVRAVEATVDAEWTSSLAPDAKIISYQAADVHDLSLLMAFNEAIGAGLATVVNDSFAHRETNVSKAVAMQYEISAQMGAALGMTIASPTGDSAGVDLPASCPHVTAIGGTVLSGTDESVWDSSGVGPSHYFDSPAWQAISGDQRRTIPDVSLAAGTPYWTLHLGNWDALWGTSFASPVFAAMIADVNGSRVAAGKSRVGFANPTLYKQQAVSASFVDIVSGSVDALDAKPGWDEASGLGSPRANQLASSMP